MIKDRKIFVVGPSSHYANWMGGTLVKTIEEADLVVFTGGADVFPGIYKEEDIHPRTSYLLDRDDMEMTAYEKALKLGKKMIGICRGHQLLSALNGAKLIQDQPNPGMHFMKTHYGDEIFINSLHHQAVFPFNLPEENYHILGWTEGLSSHHQNGRKEEMNPPVEVEMIYFPKTKCLGIQCHPEMMHTLDTLNNQKSMKFFKNQLHRFMIDCLFVDEKANEKLKRKKLVIN